MKRERYRHEEQQQMLLKQLVQRRAPRLRAIYFVVGMLSVAIGVAGVEYGAALLYFSFALLCFSMLIVPTLFAWGIIVGVFTLASVGMVAFSINELIVEGVSSDKWADSVLVHSGYVLLFVTISVGVFFAKPRSILNNE